MDVAVGPQPHLDPAARGVPAGDVLARRRLASDGAELAPQHVDEVAVERRGDTATVVVRRHQPLRVLDETGAEQEVVTRVHGFAQPGQEEGALLLVEVADRAAEERDEPRPRIAW